MMSFLIFATCSGIMWPVLLMLPMCDQAQASTTLSLDAKPPNVIFVLLDDVGISDFSYSSQDVGGLAVIPTPRMDELSAKGIRFSNHYTHPACTPTRAALMTGRYSANVGLPLSLLPGSIAGIPKGIQTLPELLKQHFGYRTEMVGKWHLGHSQWNQTPVGRGFDRHVGCYVCDIDSSMPWTPRRLDWVRASSDGIYEHFFEPRDAVDAITDEAITVMKERGKEDEPTFLYVAYTTSHVHLQPQKHLVEACGSLVHKWRREFCGMMVGIDKAVSNISDAASKYLGENTVLIVSSDNGGSTWHGGVNGPLRSGKSAPFEGGVRVPAFAVDFSHHGRYLGLGGRYYRDISHITDWLPTIMSWAGASEENLHALVPDRDGYDMSQVLRQADGDIFDGLRVEILLDMYYGSEGEFRHSHEDMAAYRKGRYKYIEGIVRDPNWYSESSVDRLNTTEKGWLPIVVEKFIRTVDWWMGRRKAGSFWNMVMSEIVHPRHVAKIMESSLGGKGETLLFDLTNDPEERRNIAETNPEVASEIRAIIARTKEARPRQQKVWMTMAPEENRFDSHTEEGNCGIHWYSADKECGFIHPWIADGTDTRTLELIDSATINKTETDRMSVTLGVTAVFIPVVIVFLFCLVLEIKKGGIRRAEKSKRE